MWTSLVVILYVLLKNAAQMPFVDDQDMIETLSANGADPAFRECIRLRSLIRGFYKFDPLRSENGIEGCRELLVVVADEIGFVLGFFLQFPDQLTSLLGNPGCVGVRRTACQMNASGPQFDEEQNVDGFETNGLHGEKNRTPASDPCNAPKTCARNWKSARMLA